jgi:hypothetical protein
MSFAGLGGQTKDAQTVQVRVQVIDVQPLALDLVVPTYISASDLTQRIARDAGLGAHWPDGTRKHYWLRARGRVVLDNERLQDFGIQPGELVHLLPQPPAGSAIIERPADVVDVGSHQGDGPLGALGAVGGALVMTVLAAVSLAVPAGLHATDELNVEYLVWSAAAGLVARGAFPAFALGGLCVTAVRHVLGGEGKAPKHLAGVVPAGLLVLAAFVPALVVGIPFGDLAWALVPALLSVIAGAVAGWLAWYGAVGPMVRSPHASATEVQAEAQQMYACGLCGQAVSPDVRADCVHKCGRVFHSGCYKARMALGTADTCAVCGHKTRAA